MKTNELRNGTARMETTHHLVKEFEEDLEGQVRQVHEHRRQASRPISV